MNTRRILRMVPLLLVLAACAPLDEATGSPLRVILFIGDGMGPEQVRAGGYYLGRPPVFTSFPIRATVTTASADSDITDSAAAATAIATGTKVDNGVLSLEVPGTGRPLETMLEYASSQGMLTGLLTTTYTTHATPAAFGAHRATRTDYEGIAEDYLRSSRPNLIFGGGANGLDDAEAVAAGYQVAKTLEALVETSPSSPLLVAGLFGSGLLPYEADGGPRSAGYPSLEDMTVQALRLIGDTPGGFFLMIEGGLIDQAAHLNDAGRMVAEVAAFDRAVAAALDWATEKAEVLIVVTADHETGGIKEVADLGVGVVPRILWSTKGHTARPVDLYARGPGAERFLSLRDNTELRRATFH